MTSSILLTINLRGQVEGFKKHVDKQIVTVDVTAVGAKFAESISRKIKHTDRAETVCSRKVRISEEIVSGWETSECPFWEKPSDWKNKSRVQKIISNVNRFDEGFGVTFDFIDNK